MPNCAPSRRTRLTVVPCEMAGKRTRSSALEASLRTGRRGGSAEGQNGNGGYSRYNGFHGSCLSVRHIGGQTRGLNPGCLLTANSPTKAGPRILKPGGALQHRNECWRTSLDGFFTVCASRIARAAGQPLVFTLALLVILVWALTGPVFHYSDTWQLIINTGTTIVTFLMVFLIQNSQNRDSASMQAKLDEIIRALDNAREHFIGIEHLTDRQIELIREALEREAGKHSNKKMTAPETVDRLLRRF
jgi:low affinity Fe/Cu permease